MTDEKQIFHPGEVPAGPGVYVFRDRFGKVIYVGKALNLRKRLSSYFRPSRDTRANPKLRSLIKSISCWEFYEVKTGDESLILESQLIKQYAPRYNVLMRDDKRYLLVKINLREKLPRLELARFRKDDSNRYFGPFPNGAALRATMEFLAAYFKLRSCRISDPGQEDYKRCLNIKNCSEPCVGKISGEDYRLRVNEMLKIIDGNIAPLVKELETKMAECGGAQKYEQAAKIRDVIVNVKAIFGARNRSFEHASLPASPGDDAVADLQSALGLKKTPAVIEGFDISNIGGQMAVGGMVCFENGRPARKKYRRFRIRDVCQSDDFAMMREVFTRHYGRKLRENMPLPDLIMVDGGKGQLSSALDAMAALKCPPVAVIGLAKKNEEIFIPGRSKPVILERRRQALRLLQALRDEAHRFAVSYHRKIRNKRIQESLLDDIPGIGASRKKVLLEKFGSVRELRKAAPEQIMAQVPGIGQVFAEKVVAFLRKNH
jgi:excinuclease ABC subunit C